MRPLLGVLLLSIAAFAQHPEPKNLKILPADDKLIPTMQAFSVALGVKCDHCHVMGDFSSDEKHPKEVARHMLNLAHEINAKFPDGKRHVSCYTCHRGSIVPATAPPEAAK